MFKSPPSRGAWIEIFNGGSIIIARNESPPSRGAWIEIILASSIHSRAAVSPPSRGAWIEIPPERKLRWVYKSPPSRGAWIEIRRRAGQTGLSRQVAPLAGGVD